MKAKIKVSKIKKRRIGGAASHDVSRKVGDLWDELFYDVSSKLENDLCEDIYYIKILFCNINMLRQVMKLKVCAATIDGKEILANIKIKYEDFSSKEL